MKTASCACGCGKETGGGVFLPGHDQALRSQIERKIGGLLPLRDLVDAAEKYARGELEDEAFTMLARKAVLKSNGE